MFLNYSFIRKKVSNINLIDIAKNKWQEDREGYGVWISVFKVPQLSKKELSEPIIKELDDKIVILAYFDSFTITDWQDQVSLDDNGRVRLKNPEQRILRNNVLLLIMTKGHSGENKVNIMISEELAAIVSICVGNNMARKYIGTQFYFFNDRGHVTINSINKDIFEKPIINNDNLTLLSLIENSLNKLQDEKKRNKIKLSLRWYYMALNENGTDALLKYWISIETIGKESFKKNANIASEINEKLSMIYLMDKDVSAEYFEIGKLLRLRTDIVHDGEFIHVDAHICSYMQCVYKDLLYYALGLKSLELSKEFKENKKIDISKYLSKKKL